MCKHIAEIICEQIQVATEEKKVLGQFDEVAIERLLMDAVHVLYYTMDLMPETRLKQTLEETRVMEAVGQIVSGSSPTTATKKQFTVDGAELSEDHASATMHLFDEVVISLAEKINDFKSGGNAHMRRLTNQRLSNCYPQSFRRRGGEQGTSSHFYDSPAPMPTGTRGSRGRGFLAGARRHGPPPSEIEGGPINTSGGIVPNSRSQAHQLALKAGLPGFNQPVYRSKLEIEPDVRYSTVGQHGVTNKAIAFRTAEDKYSEMMENNAPGTGNSDAVYSVKMTEKAPLADRAEELELNSRTKQEEQPIEYESLVHYEDIADFALPENVVGLPDMKSNRRLKQDFVALLNENRGGQILIGIDDRSSGGAGLVIGVPLNRYPPTITYCMHIG